MSLDSIRHIQDAVEACKSQFHKIISNPAIASDPEAKLVLDGGLKVCLETFIAKLGVLAVECKVAALTVDCNLSTQLSHLNVHQPQLANKWPHIAEPFGHEMWQEREKALKADIEQWFEKIMMIPEEDFDRDESTIQHRANYKEDSSSKYQDKENKLKIVPALNRPRAVNIGMTPARTTLAYVMHHEDYVVDGLPTDDYLYSFSKSSNGAWLACYKSDSYAIDSRACSARKMADSAERCAMKMVTRDSVQIVFQMNSKPLVYVNDIKTGSLQHKIKSTKCSDGYGITSRFITSNDTGVYYLSDTNLVCCTWASLSMSKFDACSILQADVIDFDLTSDSYVCITTRNTLAIDGDDMSDIKSKASYRHLTTVGIIGSHAVCSATLTDDSAVILAYDMNGVFESSVMIQVTKSYYNKGNDGICWIMPADVTHGHAAFIAVERHNYVHLVVIDSHGKLSVTSRVEVTKSQHPRIYCVSAHDVEGRFIVGGRQWIKKISVKM